MSFFSPKRAKNVKKARLNIHFRIKTFVGKEKLYNFAICNKRIFLLLNSKYL